MSDTEVERVARALHQSADKRSPIDCRVAWKDCLPVYREMLLSDARAVIDARSRPSPRIA